MVFGFRLGCIRICRDSTPNTEDQMEKDLEHDMESGMM